MKKKYPISSEFFPLNVFTPVIDKRAIALMNRLYHMPKSLYDDPSMSIRSVMIPGYAGGAIELKLFGHSNLARCPEECELGFWIGKPFWGRGLIPEAAGELLRHAFEDPAMETVWCAYYDGNRKSERTQQKIGFRYHHTTKDADVPLLNEKRTEHINCMTKAQWITLSAKIHMEEKT